MRLDGATLRTNYYEAATTRERDITASFLRARIDGAQRLAPHKITR